MKIAVDLQALQSRESRNRGIGRYSQALLEHLFPLGGPMRYVPFAHGRLPAPELSGLGPTGGPVRTVPFTDDGLSALNDLLLRTTLLAEGVDAAFLPSPIEMTESTVPDYADFPGALYAVCYDLIPFLFAERYLSDPGVRALYTQRLRNLRHADLVFAISESTRRDAVAHLGIDPARVVNIGAGVSPFFRPLGGDAVPGWRAHFQKRFRLGDHFILYTGGEDWRKNLEGLVDAYALLPAALRRGHDLVIACRMTEAGGRALQERAERALGGGPGRLLLTNYVSEEELRALYGLCDLFVFPSLYEGFGLPLVEALACGAPVIAADNSSLVEIVRAPEQRFDGGDAASLADRMGAILGDADLRGRLAAAATAEAARFSWDAVARRVHDALAREATGHGAAARSGVPPAASDGVMFLKPRAVAERDAAAAAPVTAGPAGNGGPAGGDGSPARPRVAFFSPFRPIRSGVADYSEEILPALSDYYELDLYVDDGYAPIVETGRAHRIFPHTVFDLNLRERRAGYHAIVYQMGNSVYHAYMYAALLRFGGISVLHDYNMSGMVFHTADARPELGITMAGELGHAYGEERAREILEAVNAGRLGVGDLPARGVYTNRRIFTRSLGVIVHNQWSYETALREHADANRHIALIPPVMPPVPLDASGDEVRGLRRKWGIPEDAFVFASCGIVAQTKRPLQILDAFAQHLARDRDAFLVFVGSVDMPGDFGAEIARRGLSDRVKISGYVGIETFYEYLRASDVCVTLRYPSNGETSGALLRMLVHGKPSVVTDIGSFANFPDDVVHKLPTPDRCDEVAEIVRAFRLLRGDAEYRARLGERAAAYMHREHSPERCAQLYAEFVEGVLRDPATRLRLLADLAGRELARNAAAAGTLSDRQMEALLAPFVATLTAAGAPSAVAG